MKQIPFNTTKTFLKALPVLTALLLNIAPVQSQQLDAAMEPIGNLITDRPDATESPNTVAKGYWQYEGGFLYSRDTPGYGSLDKTVYNTSLFRIGLLDNFELRLGINSQKERAELLDGAVRRREFSGATPLLLGFKTTLLESDGAGPTIGFLGHLYLPFAAANAFKTTHTGADFRFSVAHSLSEKNGIAYNIGAQWGGDTAAMAYVYTLSFSHAINQKLGLYLEVYGDLPEQQGPNHSWDSGITYLVNPSFQIDATVGAGWNTPQAILLSTGLSLRFPKTLKK